MPCNVIYLTHLCWCKPLTVSECWRVHHFRLYPLRGIVHFAGVLLNVSKALLLYVFAKVLLSDFNATLYAGLGLVARCQ